VSLRPPTRGRVDPPAPDPRVSAPTRDLGLRTQPRSPTEDEPTSEADIDTPQAAADAARPTAQTPI
jgi:hypothetical protein